MFDQTVSFSELASEGLIEVGAGRPRTVLEQYPSLPILRVADVLDGKIGSSSQEYAPGGSYKAIGSKISRPGDVVLTVKGTVGRVALMPTDGPDFAYSPQLCYFRPVADGPLRSRYLYYWFKSTQFWNQANALKGQTDMADYLSLSDIQALRIKLPSPEQQDGIIEILGSIDDKIAVNDGIAERCSELAVAYFDNAAKAASDAPLSHVADPILGGTPDRSIVDYWGHGTPWASARDVTGAAFGIVVSTEEEITDRAVAETKAKPIRRGSVILTARGTVGAVARVGQPTSFNQSCYAFTPGKLPAAVLYLTVQAAARRMLAMSHGTVFSTVTMKTFDHINVPEFDRLAAQNLENQVSPLLDSVECRVRESLSLVNIRDALLPKLMSGEIRVRDAEKVVEDVT